MPLTPEQIAEIRQRAEKATPGPWIKDGQLIYALDELPHRWHNGKPVMANRFHARIEGCNGLASQDEIANTTDFLYCSRTDIPALCDSHDAQAARIAELAAQLAQRDKAIAEVREVVSVQYCDEDCASGRLKCSVCGTSGEEHPSFFKTENGELQIDFSICPDFEWIPAKPCNCWKSRALAALDQKEPGA